MSTTLITRANARRLRAHDDRIATTIPLDALEPLPQFFAQGGLCDDTPPGLAGCTVGVLVGEDSDALLLDRLRAELSDAGAEMTLIAPRAVRVLSAVGTPMPVHHSLAGAPSVLFDAVVLLVSHAGVLAYQRDPGVLAWVRDAFTNLKVMGFDAPAAPLLAQAGIEPGEGVVSLAGEDGVRAFVHAAMTPRIWGRVSQLPR